MHRHAPAGLYRVLSSRHGSRIPADTPVYADLLGHLPRSLSVNTELQPYSTLNTHTDCNKTTCQEGCQCHPLIKSDSFKFTQQSTQHSLTVPCLNDDGKSCCIDKVHTNICPVTSVHQVSKSNVCRAHTTTTSYDVLLVRIQCLDGVSTVTAEIL